MGIIAKVVGGLEIACGIFFILVFMAWLGLVFLIPTVIVQIVLLYKIDEFVKRKMA